MRLYCFYLYATTPYDAHEAVRGCKVLNDVDTYVDKHPREWK